MLQHRESSVSRCTAGLLLCVAVVALASGPALAQTNANLQNGSFESGTGSTIPGWTFFVTSGAGSASIAIRSVKPKVPADTGNQSVQFTVNRAGNLGLASSRVAASANTRYRFTARLQTAKDQQGTLHAVEWGASGQQLRDTTLAISSGLNNGWETLRGYLVTQPQTQSVEIRLIPVLPAFTSGAATLFWDSVDLTRGDATAWETWETGLTSSTDYSPPVANPYKDLLLTATFYKVTGTTCAAPPASCTGAGCFQGYGFWDGVPGSSGRAFRLRTLLPAGNWCWAVRCAGPAGLCSGDAGLNTQSAQPLTVLPNITPANKLYALGMPRVSSSSRFLVYGDQTTTLPWIADTAWEAPVRYTPPLQDPIPSHDLWRAFVRDRAAKGFTAILTAAAPKYLSQLPADGAVPGFRKVSGCQAGDSTVEPNECTYWDAAYWQNFDQMVKAANDAGLIVVVVGLMDPTDRGGTNTTGISARFPTTDATTVFARNFASRLAGNYVIFSPGFDDRQGDATVDGKTAKDSMKAVGAALKLGGLTLSPVPAVPRHMVVDHLAGGSPSTDYDLFQNDPWLAFQMFQSGHGANASGVDGQCSTGADPWIYSICRAREIALRFRCMSDPNLPTPPCPSPKPAGNAKPAANAEAAYENFSGIGTDADTALGVRNTAYATGLSGSIGFTLGIEGISKWDNPALFSDNYNNNQSRSDNDLSLLASLFRGAPWTDLAPRHNLILNNSTNEKQKMLLAGSSTYAILYAPTLALNGSIVVSTTSSSNTLPDLNCKSWSKIWINLVSGTTKPANCSTGQGTITFSGPPACLAGQCDRVLKLTANSGAPPPPSGGSSPTMNNFMVWSSEAPDGSTSAIIGQFMDSDGNPIGDSITVDPDGENFGKLPTVAVNSAGNFLVAWQAEFPDGRLDMISTRWLDANGNPLGDTVQMSAATDGQQAEPAIISDDAGGTTIITWTAYAIDGNSSGIYRQDVPDGGVPPDMPMLVSDPSQLVVSSSQVQASAQGSSVVAWNGTDGSTGVPGVYFQRFNSHGKPVGRQHRVGHQSSGRRHLIKLAVDSPGNFQIRWESYGPAGDFLGFFEQRYSSDGNEDGGETQVTSNP